MLDQAVLRQSWSDWILSQVRPDVFGGLTHDPKRRVMKMDGQRASQRGFTHLAPRLTDDPHQPRRMTDIPIGRDPCIARVYGWLLECEQRLDEGIAAVVAVEYHKNGAPHAHPLVQLERGLERGDIVKMGLPWYRANGGNRLQAPRSAGDVAEYASKYVAKDLDQGELLLWPRAGAIEPVPVMRPGQVHAIRERMGYSVQRFARWLQVPASAVHWWEQGSYQPEPLVRRQLHAVGVTV